MSISRAELTTLARLHSPRLNAVDILRGVEFRDRDIILVLVPRWRRD